MESIKRVLLQITTVMPYGSTHRRSVEMSPEEYNEFINILRDAMNTGKYNQPYINLLNSIIYGKRCF